MQMMMESMGVVVSGILVAWMLGGVMGFGGCHFPAMYNFGDSNSDTGAISASFLPITEPYGDQFFHKAGARDCDGRLIVDFIAEHLKLPYLSAYLDSIGGNFGEGQSFGANFRHGANFATGGSTILRPNETIYEYGISPFFLDMQISQFEQFKARTSDLYNQARSGIQRRRLPRPWEFSKAIYTFDIGQNDLSVGFRHMTYDQIRVSIPNIINQFTQAIQRLYQGGARTFWIHNTGPVGCLPVAVMYIQDPPPGLLDERGCVKAQNDMAEEFNKQLKQAVIKLREQLPEAAITHVDLYAAKYGLISKAKELGFADPLQRCCGARVNDYNVWCGQMANINGTQVFGGSCADPLSYISWDGVHYTEAANHWCANGMFDGSLTDTSTPLAHACHKPQSH